MTPRERLLAIAGGQSADRPYRWPDGFWGETLARWRAGGMSGPPDPDADPNPIDGARLFGIDYGYLPPWPTGLIGQEGDYELHRNPYGVIERRPKGATNPGICQYVSFPLAGRSGWPALAGRLEADAPGRFPVDWERRAASLADAEVPLILGGGHLCGFFSFLRELVGDEEVHYLFTDDPALVREMLAFQAQRLIAIIRRATAAVRVDGLFIWEDMCYRNGPLIGPALFRDFLLEPYARVIAAARERGIRFVDLDPDGDTRLLIPLWIEAGVTMHHPLEVAAGMDAVEVVRRFGDRMVFHGGFDKRVLARDRAAIDAEFARLRPGIDCGRLLVHVDHSVPPDVPWANFRHCCDRRLALARA